MEMNKDKTEICTNCKRDIPAENFTVHSLHCARNLRVCPVCKEPVLQSELADHHEKLHKLLPCKKCGENVCGTDLEDHIRDSCALTVNPCRFCALELPRRELTPHESYCGSRTESCPECKEFVMLKYKQIHLDSNHGFLKLDDEPGPTFRDVDRNARINNSVNSILAATRQNAQPSNNGNTSTAEDTVRRIIENVPPAVLRRIQNNVIGDDPRYSIWAPITDEEGASSWDMYTKRQFLPSTNEQNTRQASDTGRSLAKKEKKDKKLPSTSQGAIKKRPAPQPPIGTGSGSRDLSYWSAEARRQREERRRRETGELSAAEKLEKLKKIDTLHNRETEDVVDYSNVLTGRVWTPTGNLEPSGQRLGSGSASRSQPTQEQSTDVFKNIKPMSQREFMKRFKQLQVNEGTSVNDTNASDSNDRDINHPPENENDDRNGLTNRVNDQNGQLFGKGTQIIEFNGRVHVAFGQVTDSDRTNNCGNDELVIRNCGKSPFGAIGVNDRSDRFSNIKNDLQQLRRGLNEVIAPYNNTTTAQTPFLHNADPHNSLDELDLELLPCEFCGTPVIANNLVLHQTGCRPDLTRYNPAPFPTPPSPPASPPPPLIFEPPAPSPSPSPTPADPVIPCEFCTIALPVYLITEHQEQCQRSFGGSLLSMPD